MEALAPLAPAIAEGDILVDVRLIEIDELMAPIARAIQQRADLRDEGLALLGLGAAQQLARLLPGQVQPVQDATEGLATAAAGELRLHEAHQAPQCPTRPYLGSGKRWARRPVLRGADLLVQRGGNVRAKGGRPPLC